MTALIVVADHAMGLAALGFAAPPLLLFAGLGVLLFRERMARRR